MRRENPAAVAFGLAFGFAQMVLSFFAAGLGHGSYIPMGLAAGPATLLAVMLNSIPIAFFAIVPLWGVYGLLAGSWGVSGKAAVRGRKLLIAHNVVGLLLVTLTRGTDYSDWSTFAQYWPIETFYLAVYVASQWMVWRLLPRLDASGSPTEASRS